MRYNIFRFFALVLLNICVSICVTISLATVAVAYNSPLLLARANIRDGYNVPAMSFLNSTNPVINNRGDVTFKVMGVEGKYDQALWFKKNEELHGSIIYLAPDQRFITDPAMNDTGKIVFNLHDEGVTDGLFVLDSSTLKIKQILSPDDLSIQYYTYPQVTNNEHVFFRSTDDFDVRSFYRVKDDGPDNIFTEGVDTVANFGIKASYIFKPAINDMGAIVFKVRLGEKNEWEEKRPDQIVMITPSTSGEKTSAKLTIVAKDRDSDILSPYLQFGNNVSISQQGMVAFMAVLDNFKKTIVVFHDNLLTNVAVEGSNNISEIELWTPKINNRGEVVFKAKDINGKRGIYLAYESMVVKLIGEGDDVMTDVGPGKILSNPNYPGLGGEIDINDFGEVVFSCLIVDANNSELGSAVYKMTPKK